jgi:hypothetical protein
LIQVRALSLALLSVIPALGGSAFKGCVESRPASEQQADPGWLPRHADRVWRRLALALAEDVRERRADLQRRILAGVATLKEKPDVPEEDESELETRGTYGRLPEVRVDVGTGAIFPMPWNKPQRMSWYQAAHQAVRLRRDLRRLDRLLASWEEEEPEGRATKFAPVANAWEKAGTSHVRLSQLIRYLEEWVPQLERQWVNAGKALPESYKLIAALQKSDRTTLDALRLQLRPRRVIQRDYLPRNLAGTVRLPIATDVQDRKFIAEIEGAVDTHWNQSPWAKGLGIRFAIRWTFVPKSPEFALGRITLLEHLSRFPKGSAILTTGGLTPHVTGRALVLGPSKINPRTLAHELGHLLGFGDCYLRTLSGQGVFGLGVLEWDNPLFPDDLMCDNTVGVARAEVW